MRLFALHVFSSLCILILLIMGSNKSAEGKPQFVEPANMGMKMSIAYDIANLFMRPIAGILSTIIAASLALILFFGVITSPFGYMFGIPSRKYVLGGESNLFPPAEASPRTFNGNPFQNDFNYTESISGRSTSSHVLYQTLTKFYGSLQQEFYPDFLDSMFYLMPQSKDLRTEQCQLLTICQAHGALPHMSRNILKIYQTFSHKLAEIPGDYKEAILIGIRDETTCPDYFTNCSDNNAFTIALKSYLNLLPESWKKPVANNGMRRKGAMYLPEPKSRSSNKIHDEL